ncbi:hypothetical protein LH716_004333 [Vibrio vulnificus]|nr:hypothetical protein [Vibrio vulnificus]
MHKVKKTVMPQKKLGGFKYGVEHALDMYASSFVHLPAEFIYEKEKLAQFQSVIDTCHIYIIGYEPRVDFVNAKRVDDHMVLDFIVANDERQLQIGPIPENVKYICDDGFHYLTDESGERYWFNDNDLVRMLNSQPQGIYFEVKYIGQAYGKNGSRNALDRLTKHETLQKISIKGVPDGYKLSLLLLEVEPSNNLITAFTPNAISTGNENERIRSGLDKLYETTEAEQVSLFEAAMIKYFSPEYNKALKNSFPSTNLKILQDCYDKDISAVFAQICIDELPYKLFSDAVEPKLHHISKHDLHNDSERKVFFGV